MRSDKKALKTQAKADIQLVEEKLREWDPIGVVSDLIADVLPPSEYDDYAPHIVGLLARGASADELTAHLEYCRTQAMGLPNNHAADRSVAEQLISLWRDGGIAQSGSSLRE